MTDIIEVLQKFDYFGGGENIEIAKGKYELDYSWYTTKRKIKRIWQSKKL